MLLTVAVGCQAPAPAAPPFEYEPAPEGSLDARVAAVRHVAQREPRTCGAAALEMVLARWGRTVSQERIAREVSSEDPGGMAARDLKAFAERQGLRAFIVRGTPADLFHYLDRGIPLIVARRARYARGWGNHYMVALSCTPDREHLVLSDPEHGRIRVRLETFLPAWTAAQRFAMIVLPAAPATQPRAGSAAPQPPADRRAPPPRRPTPSAGTTDGKTPGFERFRGSGTSAQADSVQRRMPCACRSYAGWPCSRC